MIHLIFTGGTISMQRDERAGGNVPIHGGAALVGFAPELATVAPFRIDDWGKYPACHLGPEKLWELRNHVAGVMASECPAGIVITHGTDTLEETAYLLGRTLQPEVPVVLTGAMRTSGDRDWDGPRNLTDAARAAACPESRGRGTMVVFSGAIFAGSAASKVHATGLEAFDAPHQGRIGTVRNGRVEFVAPAPITGATPLVLPPSGLTARVAMVPAVTGDQGELLELARPGHDGVVIAAYGSGNLPPGMLPAIRRWIAEGKPVVLSSRCLYGEVTPVYAFPGGGATVVREGAIPAGPRTASQARMELMLCLSAGVPYGTPA